MEHVVHRPRQVDVLGNVMAHHPKMRMPGEMGGVPVASGDQIVDRKHIPAALDQVVAQMRTQKPRTSGNDCAQVPSSQALLIYTQRPNNVISRPTFDAFQDRKGCALSPPPFFCNCSLCKVGLIEKT